MIDVQELSEAQPFAETARRDILFAVEMEGLV
jgi:hypothetical protein